MLRAEEVMELAEADMTEGSRHTDEAGGRPPPPEPSDREGTETKTTAGRKAGTA